MKAQTRMNRLLDRLFKFRVIPFLGAGITEQAKMNGQVSFASTKTLKKRLIEDLRHRFSKSSWVKWLCDWECGHDQIEESCGSNCPVSLDRLCDVYFMIYGKKSAVELVRVLRIREFCDLEVTDAHRYIAFIARERLVDEVITTNYDTCMERAYRDTFGQKDSEAAKVVRSLDGYRRLGAVQFLGGSDDWALKIYKINGCAEELDEPSTILLTERDLQDFGKQVWAHDLFRDRLRSRTIVFSGFGSDEPQVRHTALRVSEEFSECSIDGEWSDQANAPFVAAYKKRLSNNQMQLIAGFGRACTHRKRQAIKNRFYDEVLCNVFSGLDAKYFEAEKEKLPADVFWKRVYQLAFLRCLERSISQASSATWFIGHPVCFLLNDMHRWLTGTSEAFGRFPQLFEIDKDTSVTPLSQWVHLARYVTPVTKGWYASLADRPVLIPMLMLVIYAIATELGLMRWDQLQKKIDANTEWLTIEVEGLPRIVICHSDRLGGLRTIPGDGRPVVAIVIGGQARHTDGAPERGRRRREYKNDDTKEDVVEIGSMYTVGIRTLFGCGLAGDPSTALSTFAKSLRAYGAAAGEGRRSIHTRTKVIGEGDATCPDTPHHVPV